MRHRPTAGRHETRFSFDFADWPASPGNKHQWIDFLTLLGVVDGLRPVAGRLRASGEGWSWHHLLRSGDAGEALDQDWVREASLASFRHPWTIYSRKGEAWRLPGQIEHGVLSEAAKEAFHELVFRHLQEHNAEYLTFDIGRFERRQRDWNRQTLRTPLATFLRSKAWVAVGTREEPRFRKASECWASRTRQGRPPRFLERMFDTVAGLVEHGERLADLVFGEALGLRDWQSADSAPARLQELAVVAPTLPTHDRRDFRKEYRRAWLDLSNTGARLLPGLDLAVSRDGRLEKLGSDAQTVPTVIVTQDPQAFEARVLSAAGYALLDIGEAPSEKVAEQLTATGGFTPRLLDGVGVQLLVDGELFVPRASDPLLTSLELGWLPEVVILGHEMLAEELERGIQRSTVERRVRAVRVRRCQTISLVVDQEDATPKDSMKWYGVPHPELPTLILSDRVRLTWTTLSRDISRTVSRLIDTRLRFLEPLLLRLALGRVADALDAPSDEALAEALRCDDRTLQKHRAALRTDLNHVLYLLMPVVAYFEDVALARQLESDAERARAAFDIRKWLRSRLTVPESATVDLVEACERAADRAGLRRELDLDYERFNRSLVALGELPLSNEAELRSMYDGYLRRLAPRILERLRRHHAADFRDEHGALGTYVERKTLAFLKFDHTWKLTRETLDNETVEAHVAKRLDHVLGEDHEVALLPLRGLLEKNRRCVRAFALRATSVIRAWCRLNGFAVRDPWRSEDPQFLTRHIENAGLLDFEPVRDAQVPALCHRAGCWPDGMPQTLEPAPLGLDQDTVEKEERRREQERQRRVIEKRSIDFAGSKLDTADPSFAESFRQLAENSIAGNDGWYQRSRRQPRLAEFDELESGGRSRRRGTNGGRRPRKPPPDDQRQAMGLASEWLAFQFPASPPRRSRRRDLVGFRESLPLLRRRRRR